MVEVAGVPAKSTTSPRHCQLSYNFAPAGIRTQCETRKTHLSNLFGLVLKKLIPVSVYHISIVQGGIADQFTLKLDITMSYGAASFLNEIGYMKSCAHVQGAGMTK